MTQEHEHTHEPIDYATEIGRYREAKDAFFGSDPRSPIPAEARVSFAGLPYFPVDEHYVLDDLVLEPYTGDEPTSFAIPTSDGQLRPAHRAGEFHFHLAGEPCRLTGYRMDGGHGDGVFVPFLDATSGHQTYGAGRYLDLEPEEDGSYSLDFNLAYHPSCVYSEGYSCPITPRENRLPIPVEAGERLAGDTPEH